MYTTYFGFREPPFHITPNPRFFYTNPCYTETYSALRYGIHGRKGFIVLTGEVGTGKTTLLRRFMLDIEPTVRVSYFQHTTLSFDELLDWICADFGIDITQTERCVEKIQKLRTFLLARLDEGGTGVLLIDEAHNLSTEVLENLRLLSNLETENERLCQIILVGQQELRSKLAQPAMRQLTQRIAIQCQLDCLKEREVGPFIDFRLQTAGYNKPGLFEPQAVQRIALYSKGIPRLINTICDNALLIAYSAKQKIVSASIIEEVATDLDLHSVPAYEPPGGVPKPGVATREEKSSTSHAMEQTTQAKTGPRRHHVNRSVYLNGSHSTSRHTRLFSRIGLGVGTLLVLLLLGAVGAAIYPQDEDAPRLQQTSSGAEAPRVQLTTPYEADQELLQPGDHLEPLELPDIAQGDTSPLPVDTSAQQPAGESDPQPSSPPHDSSASDQLPQQAQQEQTAETTQPYHMQDVPETQPTEDQAGQIGLARQIDQARHNNADQAELHVRVVKPGDTLYSLVSEVYGASDIMLLDLLKEVNPRITNFDHIRVGQKITFPPLTLETLVREQADGSTRLILTTFTDLRDAQTYANDVRQQGYAANVIPRQLTPNRRVYRVEVWGLDDSDAVDDAWALVKLPKLVKAIALTERTRG